MPQVDLSDAELSWLLGLLEGCRASITARLEAELAEVEGLQARLLASQPTRAQALAAQVQPRPPVDTQLEAEAQAIDRKLGAATPRR